MDNPFDKFQAPYRCMLDKLPPPDEDGCIWFEGHWWRNDRDEIAKTIASLGFNLKAINSGLQAARTADDQEAVRELCVRALCNIVEALLPIVGSDALLPVAHARDAIEYAAQGKRHPLTSLPGDELHTRRDAPNRIMLQTLAAAALHYFSQHLKGATQQMVATKIAQALGKGGFYVGAPGSKRQPGARTVQEWRNQCLRASKTKPADPRMREVFDSLVAEFERSRRGRDAEEYFAASLNDIVAHSRDHRI